MVLLFWNCQIFTTCIAQFPKLYYTICMCAVGLQQDSPGCSETVCAQLKDRSYVARLCTYKSRLGVVPRKYLYKVTCACSLYLTCYNHPPSHDFKWNAAPAAWVQQVEEVYVVMAVSTLWLIQYQTRGVQPWGWGLGCISHTAHGWHAYIPKVGHISIAR